MSTPAGPTVSPRTAAAKAALHWRERGYDEGTRGLERRARDDVGPDAWPHYLQGHRAGTREREEAQT